MNHILVISLLIANVIQIYYWALFLGSNQKFLDPNLVTQFRAIVIQFFITQTSDTFAIELQIIKIHPSILQQLHITNMYIPPKHSNQSPRLT